MDVVNVTADAEQFTSNVYLVIGEDGPSDADLPGGARVLIDAGTMPGVVDVIREHVATVDAVVLTHQHGDHVGQLDTVLDAFDAPLYAYDDHPRRTAALDDGQQLRLGTERYEVIETPGHAPDHVSLASETTLFSGDVFVYNDGAFDDGSFGRTDMAGQSREVLIESLHDLDRRLAPTVEHLYAGHGDPFHGDVHAALDRTIERAERREPKYPEE